jgi:hypothetical protein
MQCTLLPPLPHCSSDDVVYVHSSRIISVQVVTVGMREGELETNRKRQRLLVCVANHCITAHIYQAEGIGFRTQSMVAYLYVPHYSLT